MYIIDVAVCALVVVAVAEEKGAGSGVGGIERFEAPPGIGAAAAAGVGGNSIRGSVLNMNLNIASPKFGLFDKSALESPKPSRLSTMFSKKSKSKKNSEGMEEDDMGMADLDLDLESQESFGFKGKKGKKEKVKEEKLPFLLRVLFFGFRCAIWVVSALFGCMAAVVIGISSCLFKTVDK